MSTGSTLFKAIRRSDAPASFRWLGQHTFLLRLGGWVAIDVAFLPITGRDVRRYRDDIFRTTTCQEAADRTWLALIG